MATKPVIIQVRRGNGGLSLAINDEHVDGPELKCSATIIKTFYVPVEVIKSLIK